eukprot:s1326_g8.t1
MAEVLEASIARADTIPAEIGAVASPQHSLQASPSPKAPEGSVENSGGDSDEEFISKAMQNVGNQKQDSRDDPPAVSPRAPLRLTKSQEENLHDRLPESFERSPYYASDDGSLKEQPMIPEGIPEPFEKIHEPDWDQIPDVQDALAPKFRVQEHHLSPEAIRSRTKRIFTPRADGSKKVSDEIWNDWKAKGSRRKLLEDIFKRCGYDPETCLNRVEIMKSELTECEVTVEGDAGETEDLTHSDEDCAEDHEMQLRKKLGPPLPSESPRLSAALQDSVTSLEEAPASTLHHFAEVARAEVEPTSGLGREHCRKNASRDAHAFIGRWGLSWKVPLSFIDLGLEGEMNKFAYIKPSDFLKFLMEKAPDLLMVGYPNIDEGKASLGEFWKAYRGFHPTHRLFREQHQSRSMATTFALAFHGDEGRGLKKGNTTILMMETCLGVDSWFKSVQGTSSLICDSCDLDEPTRKRIKTNSSGVRPAAASHVCYQSTNLKEHSFLTKFVLAAIPKKEKSVLDAILLEIVRDFNSLFDVGFFARGCQWFAACTGAKGDLKWVQRVGQLNRCFGSQTSINKAMCHECLAGTADLPFEDHSHCPRWAPTCFTKRPYDVRPVLCHIPFEHQPEGEEAPHERFYRRDIFHNTKQGVFRYFVASCVMLILKLRYFDDPAGSNRREVVLDRAYNHFKWFCSTTGRSAALRSFSLSFFNSPNWFTFPWVNCKGSDTSHLVAWVHTMLVGFMNDPLKQDHMAILEQMIAAADAARKFQRICYSHNLWLCKFCAGSMTSSSSPLFVSGRRGRGKSAALGVAAALLLRRGCDKIVVTSPSLESTQQLFNSAERAARAQSSSKKDVVRKTRGVLQIAAGHLQFVCVGDLLGKEREALKNCQYLFVDEAAGIPVAEATQLLLTAKRVILATTLDGYEGSGQGFLLRALPVLQDTKKQLRHFRLREPLRWTEGGVPKQRVP